MSCVYMIIIIASMTVCVASGPASTMADEPPASANAEAQMLYEEAVALVKEEIDEEHLTKALALLDRAAGIDPGSEAIWVEIAWRSWLEMNGVLSSLALTGTLLVNKGRVDRLDPDYLYGATRRLLSEVFVRVPGWLAEKFGFNPHLVEEDLLANIEKWPYVFSNYTFLARVYVWAKQKEKALDQLDFVLKGPADRMPEERSENEREQRIARRLWKEYTGKEYPAR
jgi:hypothetical protein